MTLTKKELIEHAAVSIALFWLQSAKRILERGDKPWKLTNLVSCYVTDELDLPIYDKFRFSLADKRYIAQQATLEAKQRLQLHPEWDIVRVHFSVANAHADVTSTTSS